MQSRNKKCITLNLRESKGQELLLELARVSDVLLENFRPDVLDRLGVGWEVLQQKNPRLIYCSISGFGPDGPYADRPAYDTVAQSMSGFFSQLLDPERPRIAGPAMADAISDPPRPGPMRDSMMFQMAYNTGLRVGELVQVNIEDVDGKRTLEVIGKGKNLDTVPLNSTIRSALRRYLTWRKSQKTKDGKALFVNRLGKRITTRGVEFQLVKWLKKAKIDAKLSPHSLRHTFGTNIMRASRNIRTTQRLLRHANVTTTQIYTHVDDDETRSAVENLN